MSDEMAWMIAHRECNWSRPKSRYSFNAKASTQPQQRPRDFVAHCVAMGWATEVPSPEHDAPAARAARAQRKRAAKRASRP